MKVNDYTVALEIEYRHSKEQRYSSEVEVGQVFAHFRILCMICEAIADNYEESETEENIWGHRDVCQVLERAQPADWDQNKGCDENVQPANIALFIKRLKADHLINLLTDENEVSNGKTALWE